MKQLKLKDLYNEYRNLKRIVKETGHSIRKYGRDKELIISSELRA